MKKKATKKSAATKVKAKSETVAATPEKATPAKVNVQRERRDIEPSQLVAAPWNPRGDITPESVADLAASIATVGIIEPVVVMPGDSSTSYIIVAGHRRVKAAIVAGLATVPCDVLTGIDEAQARRMTFIENLQRKDADPLLESELVGNLIADGMTQEEIAAETGRDRKWVARRSNLTKLSTAWRKRVASGEQFTVDCLEHIAAYPIEIQERLGKIQKGYCRAVKWEDLSWYFKKETCDLSEAPFDTHSCRLCIHNTGCTPDLFDWDRKPAALGKCLEQKCFKKRVAAYIDEVRAKAEADGTVVYRHEPPYDADAQQRRDKKHTELYIYTDYNKELKIEWGRPKSKKATDTSAAREAYAEKIAAERKAKRERNKAIRKLAEWCGSGTAGEPCNLAKLLDDRIGRQPYTNRASPFAVFAIQHAFDFVGWSSYKLIGTDSEVHHCAISALFGNLTVPDTWTSRVAAEIINSLNPSHSGGWQAERNAVLILRMLGADAADKLGADIVAAIIPENDDAEKFRNPQIKWLGDGEKCDPCEPCDDDEDIEGEDTEKEGGAK